MPLTTIPSGAARELQCFRADSAQRVRELNVASRAPLDNREYPNAVFRYVQGTSQVE